MTKPERARDYLVRVRDAAENARSFCADVTEEEFRADLRTQMAVTMALVLIGEAVARLTNAFPHITEDHPQIAWSKIKGMRDVIAHDYYELELPMVWRTVAIELPQLTAEINAILDNHIQGE